MKHELGPLPEPADAYWGTFTASQMEEYALAEVARAVEFCNNTALERNAAQAVIAELAKVVVHITPTTDGGCGHDWPADSTGQTDMYGCCTKCGMSFQRYIHTECP